MKKLKNNGFTLAEVLITLSIIGVVAAMTIPSLMKKVENQSSAKALIKFYSTLMAASKSYTIDNNQDFKNSGLFEGNQDPQPFWDNFFKKYFIIQKECTPEENGCFPNTSYRYINGNDWMNLYGKAPSVIKGILSDGTLVRIWIPSGNCLTYCAEIVVDVNGHKQPNQIGRDTFAFQVLKDKIVPYPSNDIEVSGLGCTKKVLLEGNINY